MRAEIFALLDKASQSIQAAKNLKQEGYLDFAASRAYYALFYTAEALLLEDSLSYNSHAAVIAAFGKEFARTGRMDARYHRYLLDAQDTRIIGDYGIGQGVSEEQAQDSLRWAEEFLQAAQEFLSN